MRYWSAFLLALAPGMPQEDPGRDIRDLVESLRSDRIDDRDEAERRLREWGPSALPVLEEALRDRDSEVALRAARIACMVEATALLGPRLLEKIGGVEKYLSPGEDHGWTELFLKVQSMPGVTRRALSVLAPRALEGARPLPPVGDDISELLQRLRDLDSGTLVREWLSVASTVASLGLKEAIPVLREWLSNPDPDARRWGALALGHLRPPGAWELLVGLLEDPDPHVRSDAAMALGSQGSREAIPALLRALANRTKPVPEALDALKVLGPAEAVRELRRILRGSVFPGRGGLIQAYFELRSREARRFLAGPTIDDLDLGVVDALLESDGPDAPRSLIPLLGNPHSGIRQMALQRLVDLGAKEAEEAVRSLLKDPDLPVRCLAVTATASLGSGRESDDLIALLGSPEPSLRRNAASTLGWLRVQRASPFLEHLLEDPDPDVRREAAQALGSLANPKATAGLRIALGDPENLVRSAALEAFWRAAPLEALPDLLRKLGQEDLNWSPDPIVDSFRPQLLLALREALKDPQSGVRRGALRLASMLRFREAVPRMLSLTEDPHPEVRMEAVRTLAWLDVREARGAILARIWDENSMVRNSACWRLEELGVGPDAVRELRRFLRERGHDQSILDALVRLSGRGEIPLLVGFLGHPDALVRRQILQSLRVLKAREAAPSIAKLLEDPELSNRKEAIETLRVLGARTEWDGLRKRLGDSEVEVRLLAIRTLEALGAPPEVADLRPGLLDPDPRIRAASIHALGALGRREALGAIGTFFEDDSGQVRAQAVSAWAALGGRDRARALIPLLEDPDPTVSSEAARELGHLGTVEAVPKLLELLRLEADRGWANLGACNALALLGVREAIPVLTRLEEDSLEGTYLPPELHRALRRLDPEAARRTLLDFLERPELHPRRSYDALYRLQREQIRISGHGCRGEPRSAREAALEALASDLGKESIPVLRKCLSDGDPLARWTAARLLLPLLGPEEWQDAAGLLQSGGSYTQVEAAKILGQMGQREALPILLPHLSNSNPDLRAAAVWSVAKLEGADALPRLLPLLQDPDRWVRIQAAARLAWLGHEEGVPLLLSEGYVLEALNALRQPELLGRLAATSLPEIREGRRGDLLAAAVRSAGLRLDLPDPIPCLIDADLSTEQSLDPGRYRTILDVLDLPHQCLAQVTYILEPDRIRILSRGEAWNFWEEWQKSRKK